MSEEEFRELYDAHARTVWAFVVRVCRDPIVADDVVQEAFIRMLERDLSRLSSRQRKTYLFRTAANLTTDYFRRDKAHADLAEVPDSAANQSEMSIDLDRAFQQLKPAQRSLLWMAYAEGCTHDEIANVLNLRKASVKVLLFRARQKLITILHKMEW